MAVLWKENKAAFQYLSGIPKETWSRAYQPYPRYGHDTSNIIESLNSSWGDIRQLPPLQAMDAIYSYTMKMFYERANKVQKSQLIANVPLVKFEAWMKTSQRFWVFPSGIACTRLRTLKQAGSGL
jgi:hypothetical protein